MQRFTLKVTSKGQFTLPVEVRAQMNVSPGDRLELFVTRDGETILRARNRSPTAIFGRGAAYANSVTGSSREETVAGAIAARGAPSARKAG